MNLDLSAAASKQPAPLRVVRDAHRPSVSSAEVARRLGRSRTWVTEQIQNGGVDGYGVPGAHRTRWYAYEDALPTSGSGTEVEQSSAVTGLDEIVNALAEALYDERHHRVEAFALLHGAFDEMGDATAAALVGANGDAAEHQFGAQDVAANGREADRNSQQAANTVNRLLQQLTWLVSRGVDGARDRAG